MNPIDKTAPAQTDAIEFELDLVHPPQKVWRALTEPALLTEWLLPVAGLKPSQKQNSGGARYGWKLMGGKLVDLLGGLS